jgi:hypothetical protein
VLTEEEKREIRKEFAEVANMAPGKLERWLASDESKAVGGGDDVSHRAGQRIVQLKRTRMDQLIEGDYDQMQEITQYLRQRLAKRPKGDLRDSDWRRRLMNWGHDPLL